MNPHTSVAEPPRLPNESLVQYLKRKWFHRFYYDESAPPNVFGPPCEVCSATNEQGWSALKQEERLESVEKMLAGLRLRLPAEEKIEPGWDARRAELIKELEDL